MNYLEKLSSQHSLLLELINKKKEELEKNPMNQDFFKLAKVDHFKSSFKSYSNDVVTLGKPEELNSVQEQNLLEHLKNLGPWKKGPFEVFGQLIDAEWRSDQKWNRIKSYLPNLEDKTLLDIGCNNGYFMFRMLEQNPSLVLGIDPVARVYSQFKFLNNIAREERLKMELLGVEHLKYFNECFDVIFSMGIIYHHRHPLEQLLEMKNILRPGGTLILETIGIPGEEDFALFPEDRYAKMRNVWFVPTLSTLINWAKRCKYDDIEVVSSSLLTSDEQRVTEWSGPVSLDDFLDPNDKTKTIEGYPAPMRFCIKCKKKK